MVRCLTRRFLPEYAPCNEAHYKYKGLKDGKELQMTIVDSDGQVGINITEMNLQY